MASKNDTILFIQRVVNYAGLAAFKNLICRRLTMKSSVSYWSDCGSQVASSGNRTSSNTNSTIIPQNGAAAAAIRIIL